MHVEFKIWHFLFFSKVCTLVFLGSAACGQGWEIRHFLWWNFRKPTSASSFPIFKEMVDLNRRNSSPPRSEDLTNRVMMYCDKFFRYLRNLSNKPVPIQIGVGASSGFVLSYFFTKGSKICALLLGCSFILLQVGIAFFISMFDYNCFRFSVLQLPWLYSI